MQGFYDGVFKTLYSEELDEIKRLLDKRSFVLVYVNKKDHPTEFFHFVGNFLKADNRRTLATSDDSNELPSELRAEDASSVEFLSESGLEIWWVSENSPNRVHEIMRKMIKGKWAKSLVMMTDDDSLFSSQAKIGKNSLLTLRLLRDERLAEFVEHYAVSIGCEDTRCLVSLKDIDVEAHMTDAERLVQYVRQAIELCHICTPCLSPQCLGISPELAKTLIIHFAQDRTSLLVSLRMKLMDFVSMIYEKDSQIPIQSKIALKDLSRSKIVGSDFAPIDSLIMMLELRKLRLLCPDFEDKVCIFNPSKEAVYRKINMQSMIGILEESRPQIERENLDEILSSLGASGKDLDRFETLFRRRLNEEIAQNLGVLLWFRRNLCSISSEMSPTQEEVKDLLLAKSSNAAQGSHSAQWARALDFLQALEKLNLCSSVDTALCSFHINEKELTQARRIAEHLLENALETWLQKTRSLLLGGSDSDAILKLRDDFCTEMCDCILFAADLGIIPKGSKSAELAETLGEFVDCIDYRRANYDWKKIGLKVLAACISLCETDLSISRFSYSISESLLFEDSYAVNQEKIADLRQAFESLKGDVEGRTENNLKPFLRMIDLVRHLSSELAEYGHLRRKLSDVKKLESEFESLYFEIVSWASTEKRLGVVNSLLVFDIVCQAFGLFKSEYIPSELGQMLSAQFDDVVLVVVDAMSSSFVDFFQRFRRFPVKVFSGFSVFPSETAPGHTSIFTGMPPSRSRIFSNELVFENHSVSLIYSRYGQFRPLSEQEDHALVGVFDNSLSKRLEGVGIGTTIFMPAKYSKSALTKIILGGSLKNADVYECKSGVDLFKEARMIPAGIGLKQFYIILDDEIDAGQHAGLERYCYDEKQIEKQLMHHREYFEKLSSFLRDIVENATRKKRRMLVVVTADHGATILKRVDSSFSDILEKCGLDIIGSRERSVDYPEKVRLRGGIYSKYDLTLFENTKVCKLVGLSRKQVEESCLGSSSLRTLQNARSRVVLIYARNPERFDSTRVLSMYCNECGFDEIVAISKGSFCPRCGSRDFKAVDLGTIRTRIMEASKDFGYHPLFIGLEDSTRGSNILKNPHLIIFPGFDSVISKYPSNPRETIMYLLKQEKRPVSEEDLRKKYAGINMVDNLDEKSRSEFDKALQELKDLHHLEDRPGGYVSPITEDYSGACTVITHGGISPAETIVPFAILKNEVVRD